MRNLVVGTAGHIDHGKTALVKALTGIDTDRLKEEKEQGISIVTGFAHMTLPSGRILEIVDVPGHEKLIKNMYRGISGVDIALLVIAADDGPMPQTKEHLNILNLLGIEHGLVVVTKTDLADEELLSLVEEEIGKVLRGTVFEEAPLLRVSNKTGEGLDEVEATLEELANRFDVEIDERAFRLPIDRVFVMPGHGSVVTGTVASGRIIEGDEVQIFPSQKMTKVRAIQVHNAKAAEALAGQRVGLNLPNVSASSISRGMVLSRPAALNPTHLLNSSLYYLPSNKKALRDRTKVRLHSGTSEALARIVIMDGEEILPGETKHVQLRLESELVPLPFDKYIIRSLSPIATIGGGVILEIAARKYRTHDPATINFLQVLERGRAKDMVEAAIERCKYHSLTTGELIVQTGLNEGECLKAIEKLEEKGRIVGLDEATFIHGKTVRYLRRKITEAIELCYKDNPLQRNLAKDKVRKLVEESLAPRVFDLVVNDLAGDNVLEMRKEGLRLKNNESRLTAREQKLVRELGRMFEGSGLKPLRLGEVAEALSFCREKDIETVLKFLVAEGRLMRLQDGSFMEVESYRKARDLILQFIRDNRQATAVQIRDLLGGGRRGAIAILEHLDSVKLTLRIDDYRVMRKG